MQSGQFKMKQPCKNSNSNKTSDLAHSLQEQAQGLQKYLQHLGSLPAFQKGIEQALTKEPKQALQNALPEGFVPQKPRLPIPGDFMHAAWHECPVGHH